MGSTSNLQVNGNNIPLLVKLLQQQSGRERAINLGMLHDIGFCGRLDSIIIL